MRLSQMLKSLRKALLIDNHALLLIITGSVVWSLTMVKSGIGYGYGIGFWGPNGHDGVWHIALASSLAKGSLEMPVFAGEVIKNYHIGFDLILAALNKATLIPISVLYFQIIPPILAFATGVLVYKFIIYWKKDKSIALWTLFFVYFGGNLGWIVTLMRGQGLAGESMFWSQQATLTLINPPFALSVAILMLGMIYLIKSKNLLLPVILFGILIQIKAYAGVLILGGLFVSGVYQLVREKNSRFLKIFAGSLVLSIILFLPLNRNSGGLLVWQPFWFLETMLGLTDRLGWLRFYEALMNYKLAGSIKLYPAYAVAFVIFLVGNFWTRLLGILSIKKVDSVNVLLLSMVTSAVVAPMFFVQAGTPWNTIQFVYYALFLSALYAGEAISKIKRKYLIVLVVAATIPTTFATLKHYLPSRPPSKLAYEEVEALTFLKAQPDGTVLTFPFDRYKALEAVSNPPRPLHLYESTSYVSAYSGHSVFLEDEVNLTIMNYNWPQRRKEIEEFYRSLDHELTYNFLRDKNIKYVYWLDGQRATLGETQLGLKQVFDNGVARIYEVK